MPKEYIRHAYKLTQPFKVHLSGTSKRQVEELGFERVSDYTVILPIGTTVIYDGGNGYDVSHWVVKDAPTNGKRLPEFGENSGGHDWMSSYGTYMQLKSKSASDYLMHIYEE